MSRYDDLAVGVHDHCRRVFGAAEVGDDGAAGAEARIEATRRVVPRDGGVAVASPRDDQLAARCDCDGTRPVGAADIGDHLSLRPERNVELPGRGERGRQRRREHREAERAHDACDARAPTHRTH